MDFSSKIDQTEKRLNKLCLVSLSDKNISVKKGQKYQEYETWGLNPKRFSKWLRLVRVRAWVNRVIHNMRNPSDKIEGLDLSPEEILDSENQIIGFAQVESFTSEYMNLSSGKCLTGKSSLLNLNPRIDDHGVLRSEGRLQNAQMLAYDIRYPIILPRGCWVTKLIVRYYHEMACHTGGVNFILGQMSSKYWVIAGREEIRECENECVVCQKVKNKRASQIMGPLPPVRVRFTYKAFDQTGVDFAGPFLTVQGRGQKRFKRWLCLFTCLSTRAVHLELAYGLDTDSFLRAFMRFCHRRGTPKEMLSDNSTNFVGAANELQDLVN
jgi:hypothetical protein